MQKIYCDGCGVELIEIPFISDGPFLRPIAKEIDGVLDRQTLTIDSEQYDLCETCRKRIKAAIKTELKAIAKETEGKNG